jgi:hypothetical protein
MAEILPLGSHTKAIRTVSDKTPGDIGSQKQLVMKQSFLKVSGGDNKDHQADVTDKKIACLIAFISSEHVTKYSILIPRTGAVQKL